MAIISRVKIDNFRNLKSIDLELAPRCNIFFGDNGSGKTSFLEAIHVLSVGKSFRTTKVEPLLAENAKEFFIYSELESGDRIGLVRSNSGPPTLRLNTDSQTSWKDVATLLPVQVINSDIFLLVEGGAGVRRRLLDWVLFHVEHSYLGCWRNYRRLIQQRNALLKHGPRDLASQLTVWDRELSKAGEEIHYYRKWLMSEYELVLSTTIEELLPGSDFDIKIEYKKGWIAGTSLDRALDQIRDKDIKYKATNCGPHRAELLITSRGRSVSDVFSRGQIKLLGCALRISMSRYLIEKKRQQGVKNYSTSFLVDDIASELDEKSSRLITCALFKNNDQCIFTSISKDSLSFLTQLIDTSGKFHVEHGKIQIDR